MRALRAFGKRIVLATPAAPKLFVKRLLPESAVKAFQRAVSNGATRRAQSRPRSPGVSSKVLRLEQRLWGGYSGYAVGDLEAEIVSPTSAIQDRIHAAIVLGRYYSARGEHKVALEKLAFARTAAPRRSSEKRIRWVEVYSLIALGRLDDAEHLVRLSLAGDSLDDGDAYVAMAAIARARDLACGRKRQPSEQGTEEFLEWVSKPLEQAGFSGLTRRNANRPLAFDNLAGRDGALERRHDGPKVSVLMAAFNAQANIAIAIRSILAQTWQNLELIVVDDASTDATWDLIESFARQDERVVPLRLAENVGAYAARNTALGRASGDYVVVNDSDDWAHPQKIQAQVEDLEERNGVGANMTSRLRVNSMLMPEPRLDSPNVPIIHNDFSALMLRRERIVELGGWDPVRFSADAEFVERLRASQKDFDLRKIHPTVPMSISLFDGSNLTASSSTGIWTNRFGSRQEYERAFRSWHMDGQLRLERRSQTDPFPVPSLAYHGRGFQQHFDIVLVSDFRLPGGTTHCNLQYLRAFRRLGLTVAVLNWPRYDIEPKRPGLPLITQACRELGIVPLVHGESATCQLVLIHHPPIMMWRPDAIPTISARRGAILANQTAQRVLNGPNEMYEPAVVQEAIEEQFGVTAQWLPISPLVRRMMEASGGFDPISPHDWLPILGPDMERRSPRWRGRDRTQPVVGRHGRDHWTKWPGDAAELSAAFCAGQHVTVRLMGGADAALRTLGARPANWELLEFDQEDVPTFLSSLDFFVNFIHEESLEAFGRNIVEAMAMGLPVICSESFEECFGSAAIYCRPEDVGRVVAELWADESRYLEIAAAGHRFVEQNCSMDQVQARLRALGVEFARLDEGAASAG